MLSGFNRDEQIASLVSEVTTQAKSAHLRVLAGKYYRQVLVAYRVWKGYVSLACCSSYLSTNSNAKEQDLSPHYICKNSRFVFRTVAVLYDCSDLSVLSSLSSAKICGTLDHAF